MVTKTEANQAKGIDKKFLIASLLAQAELMQIAEDTANDMVDEVMSHATANGIRDEQVLLTALFAILAISMIRFDSTMETGIVNVATAKKTQFYQDSVALLREAGAYDAANAFNVTLNNLVEDAQKSFRFVKSGPYDLTFVDRIGALESSTRKVLQNIVQLGVRQQNSAAEIAEVIRSFISPADTKAKPWDIVRKRFGITDGRIPADILPGTYESNIDNITRTQLGDFYRDLTHETYKDKEWIDHFDWVLSRSHPKVDSCDDKAKASPYSVNDERPESHNYCLCDWVAVPKTVEQIRELLAQGVL